MSQVVSTFQLTQEQFATAKTLLHTQYGQIFEGNTWKSPSHMDTDIQLTYDGESNLLVIAEGLFAKQAMERVQALIAAAQAIQTETA